MTTERSSPGMSGAALDTACVALRSFVHRSGALRAQAILSTGSDGAPAVVSCVRLGPLEIATANRTVQLPHDIVLDGPEPDLGELRPLPPFEVSAARGEVAGMIGGWDLLTDALVKVTEALGPQAVVVVEMESMTPDTPLVLSARLGEPLLVTLGEESFDL